MLPQRRTAGRPVAGGNWEEPYMPFQYAHAFRDALASIKREGRYRVFADIVRRRGSYPTASHYTEGSAKPISVWCSRTMW